MSSTENIVKTRVLKEIWQEYLKTVQEKEKERKIKELLLALEEYEWSEDSLSFPDSELVSIGNLLGCELLKVISHQCEILEHDSALVHYFQKGLGLYLLQVLNILADQVNNGSAEVSNVLVSILPCLLSVACEYKDNDAFVLLQKVSMLYKDISSSKKIPQNLYSTLLPSHKHTVIKELTILQLFALILDIINKLTSKGCSFAVAESSFNIAEKLSSLLLSFVKDCASRESRNSITNEDLPECTWTPTIKLVCIYMVMCPLWTVSVGRGGVDAFSHRIDQSELVCKLLEMLKKFKNGIWDGSGFRNLEGNVLEYQLFLMYCLLGMLLTLLKHSVCGETGSQSGLDLTRKLHSKEQVESFVKLGGPELIKFVSLSLSKLHNSELKVGLDINTLLKQKAILVITTTGQLISAMKKALVFLNKCEDQKLEFSLERVTSSSNPHGQEFRFPGVRSSGSCLPSTFESSTDTDSEPHQAVNTSQHQCHFHKDCVVASLCCAMLLLYQESTVEEIDVDCLNTLSRCGTCQCIDVSITSAALLSRFVKRSSHVQDMALRLFCKILLIDQNFPDSNNTNDVFNEETTPTTPERWSCLEQLFLLSTQHVGELTVKILKHLKVLAKFGSASLREALFTKVILPFVLRYKDIKRVNALAQVWRKLAFASSNPDDSGYGTPTETNERETSKSGDPSSSQEQKSKIVVSDDALRISMTSLLALLENNRLKKLFLNSDGVKSIVSFLGDESLHPICLGILQLLAIQDDRKTVSSKRNVNRNESFEKRNSETASGNAEPVVVNILLRSMLLVDPLKSDTVGSSLSEFAPKIRISLRTPNVSRLLCQLWRTCLELLRRNTVFRELFVQCNGPAYVIAVLQVVKECLYRASSSDEVVRDHVIACVAFMELAVAVGLEFEEMFVDGVQVYLQITEAVRIIQRLVQQNKVLKDKAGKTFCVILLNLAVGTVTEESSSKADIHDSEKLLFDFGNSDGSGSDNDVFDTGTSKMNRGCFVKDVEPGYEADVEPDNGTSDVSGKENGLCLGQRRRTKESLPKRRLETVEGHVQYPQMCEQLVNLLEHHGEMTANDRALALFGLEGIISLASYSVRNRQILCQQGILQLVLKTFTSCLTSMDISAKAVQKTVLDLVVVLASYEFSSEELKMYLKFLEINKPAWGLLVKALRNISSLSASSHGPTYAHVFPVQTSTTSSENSIYSSSPNSSARKKLEEQYKGDFKKDSPKIATPKKLRRRAHIRSPALNVPELDGILLSPWCVRSLELNLNQSLPWPVGSFSLAFWLYLDSGFVGHGDGEHRARSPRGRRSCCSHYERRRSRDRLRKRGGNLRTEESGDFIHVVSFGTKTALFEVWVNVLKTTLICRWSRTNTPDNSLAGVSPPKEAFVKFPFKDYVWNHFVLSVQAGREDDVSAGRVTLIVDGSVETTKPLSYPRIAVRKNEQVSVLVGETLSNNKNGPRNSREKLQSRPFCRLGNITTFIGDVHRDNSHLSGFISMLNSSSKANDRLRTMDKLEAAYLYLLGANCQAIDFHLGEETSESYSKQLDLKILGKLSECSSQSFLCGPHGEPVLVDEQQLNDVKDSLKKQLLLVYSAVSPSAFLEYKLEGTNWTGNTSYGDNVMTGNVSHSIPLSVVRRKCLVEAIHSVGGIGVLLYLFAKTVEVSDDERAQADTLQIIFTIAKENVIYAKELEGLLAQKMILKVLLTPNCKPGYHFAKVFFYAACEGEVFRETGLHDKPYLVNLSTTAIIKNVEILRDFLLIWRVWYRPSSPLVWETVLLALEALTRTSHPNSEFNIKQFQRADALGTLLLGCQEIQAEDLQFPPSTTSLLLNIIQNLLGCSADPQVLKRICEFLIAVHPTYETLVLHAPGKIYFTPIIKLQDRKHSRDLGEESRASCGGNHENAIDKAIVDGKTETGELPKSQNESMERNLESSDSGNTGEQELTEKSDVMETTASELCHNELARTNVLNTDDSKDMIISVELLYKKDRENSDMQFPLQAPELEPKSEDSASFVEVTDDTDGSHGSPQRPVQPNAILSPQGSRKHSEPITIIPREVTTSVADSYDVVSSSELSATKSSSSQIANSNDDYLVVDNKPGNMSTMSTYRHFRRQISEVREHKKLDDLRIGLLELIYGALINLADTAVDIVLGEILKVEYFLCFVNHPVARIRTLSVEILFKILERASTNVVNSFYQMSGYHLLAVQIHLYPITQELAEACFLLFFQQPVSINQPNFFDSIKRGSELTKKVNIQAVVPLLGMLEGSVSCPAVFRFLTQSLVRMIDVVEDFLLKATDHGLLKTFVNAVRALCVWRMNNSGKRSEVETSEELSLDNLQYLVMAIVYRSLRMCGDRYFQIFDDLLLSLDRLQYSEPGSKRLTTLLIQCSRFLQHCAVRFALEYFEYSQRSIKINKRSIKTALRFPFKSTNEMLNLSEGVNNNSVTDWATLDSSVLPVPWKTSRRMSLPAEATPTELISRFQDVCMKAVSFIYFSDTWPRVDNTLDFNISYSQFTLPPPFEAYKQADSSFLVNATETFTQWTFCFLLELLDFCLNDGMQRSLNKWHELVQQSKEKIRHQLCRLLIHLMCPKQGSKQKLFALQLAKLKRGNEIFLNLLLGAVTTKQKERAVAYVRAFLREPEDDFTSEEKEVRETVREWLKDIEVQKMENSVEDHLSQKQQEWEKQDRNNKRQWENKKELDNKRGEQGLHQLYKRMMSVAMEVTKVTVDVQDKQRQNLLKYVKGALSSDVQSHKLWQMLIKQMTHERAVWHDKVFFPTSWQLDRTEGPCRVRCRLQRCHLDIDEKYVMPEYRKQQSSTLPLSYLFEEHCGDGSSKNVYHIFNTTDTIRFLHRCKSIMPARKVQGEILIGEKRVYFVGEETVTDLNTAQFFLDEEDVTSISWLFQEIREILRRRYALKDNALEIFLTNGRTFLLAFETTQDRETVLKELIAKELPNLITATENVSELTQRWQNGELTNFAYLTELNKQACRSFNDLMQYPVFPLVLAEYSCDVLDLTNRSVYRDLSKPVAVQNPSRVPRFKETYRNLQEQYDISKKVDPMNCIPPYHYGSHYSNSGTVLHFLVRLVPFTKMFLTYQDMQFDVPDRTFHAIETTWNLSSLASAPDVKELIPEFFFLPEFLLNSEGFEFGLRQNGERVMNVLLPSWACKDVRLFTLIHRQALESDVVSSTINQWIDLVFGFKQEGEAAVEAVNVFHPSTYVGGIDENKLLEPLQRAAVQTMIETYGQTPAPLFTEPHPERKRIQGLDQYSSWSGTFGESDGQGNQILRSLTTERDVYRPQEVSSPVPTVFGIKWGQYIGSPTYPKPVLCWSDSFPPLVSNVVSFPSSHVFLLPPNSTHMIVTRWKNRSIHVLWSAVLSWNHVDDILRIRDIKKGTTSCFTENMNLHKVTCCAVSEECRSLWVGSSTGCLCVWPTRYDRTNECGLELLGRRIRLQGHQVSITCVEICEAFSIVVTGSDDRTAIIWDLNRLCYIRCLTGHSTTVDIVSTSPTSGDIVTVCRTETGNASELRLWSVNGRLIKKIVCHQRITCVQFSRAPEGVSVNSIAAGLTNGVVRLWNTWTLEHIGDIKDDTCQLPVVCLAYSHTCHHLFTADSSGTVRAWGRTERASYKPRILNGLEH